MVESAEKLALLCALGREINASLDIDAFVPRAIESISRITGADLTMIYLRQGNQMILKGVYPQKGRFDQVGNRVEEVGNCLCGLAGAGNVIYSSDIHSDPNCVYDECKKAGVKSFAALPIAVLDEVLGVLSLASTTTRDFRQESDFIEAVTFQTALALQNLLLSDTMGKQVEALEKAVEKRKRSEERYQIVSGLTSDYAYAYRVEPDGQIVNDWVTGAFKRISGYTKEEIHARGGWETLIYPQDLPIPTEQFKALFKNKATEVEYRIISKTGEIRWMRDSARPVMDESGAKLIYIYGAVQDISERKDAEVALQASEEKYRQLVENINDAIFMADKDGKIVYISPAIEAVAGYKPLELIGKNAPDFVYQEDLPSLKERYKELLKGIISLTEYRIVTKTGQPRWVRVSSTPVFNGKDLNGIWGIMTDIDESKWVEEENRRLQEQLQQAQKMEAIGTLAGGIAHDFNNILAAIIGYTEMALVGAEKDSALYQNLQEVFLAGGRAKDLVKQILTFSRQTEQQHQPVQVKLIAREVAKFMRASLPATIKIKQDLRSDALVMADPTQVYQIILNLCTNAGHAMSDAGGLLEIKLADIDIDAELTAGFPDLRPGPYIQLTVSDTGHGISKSNRQRIFEPFFTTKEKEKGTGMGLSVVHGIVGSNGGQITVTSDLGIGSTFTVYLPIIEHLEGTKRQPEEQIDTGTEHILLVDDERALVRIGKKTLESLGYKVTARTSSIEALELFKARPGAFDLVITDMTMPNMAGDRLAKEILHIKPKIPIILCSGYSSRIDQDLAFSIGIRAFVTKPILRREIAKTVRTVLDETGDN